LFSPCEAVLVILIIQYCGKYGKMDELAKTKGVVEVEADQGGGD